MKPANKPCSKEYCFKEAKEFEDALIEDGMVVTRTKPKLFKCGKCGILVCAYHSTALVMFRDEHGNRKQIAYKPAICRRCSWLEDNAGLHGRPAGWIATRVPIPW